MSRARPGLVRSAMSPTRDRMIATTAHLLRAQGFHGTGLNQITADALAPKGSMYHHFPGGKEQLAEEAIRYYADVVLSLLEHCLENPDVPDALDAFVGALSHQLERSAFLDGCPVGLTAMEAGATSDRLAAATQAAFDRWISAVARRLEKDGVPDAHERATTVIAAVEGGVMLARAHRSTAALRAISRSLAPLVVSCG
jgi:TetR/AcrR family transcriptional repressor of lmrAB and yxaGH operons